MLHINGNSNVINNTFSLPLFVDTHVVYIRCDILWREWAPWIFSDIMLAFVFPGVHCVRSSNLPPELLLFPVRIKPAVAILRKREMTRVSLCALYMKVGDSESCVRLIASTVAGEIEFYLAGWNRSSLRKLLGTSKIRQELRRTKISGIIYITIGRY